MWAARFVPKHGERFALARPEVKVKGKGKGGPGKPISPPGREEPQGAAGAGGLSPPDPLPQTRIQESEVNRDSGVLTASAVFGLSRPLGVPERNSTGGGRIWPVGVLAMWDACRYHLWRTLQVDGIPLWWDSLLIPPGGTQAAQAGPLRSPTSHLIHDISWRGRSASDKCGTAQGVDQSIAILRTGLLHAGLAEGRWLRYFERDCFRAGLVEGRVSDTSTETAAGGISRGTLVRYSARGYPQAGSDGGRRCLTTRNR